MTKRDSRSPKSRPSTLAQSILSYRAFDFRNQLGAIDLTDVSSSAANDMSGLTESAIAERVAEFGKHVEILYAKKRNKKPPQGSLVRDFEVGINLLAALTKSFRREFGRSAASAASTFTGSGWYGDSDLGSLSRLTSQLRVVSLSLHRLTEIARVFQSKDILREFDDLWTTTDAEYQTFEDENRTTAFSLLWWHWCVGYSLPGQFITASQADEDRFAPWRYIPWGTYFQRALYFYLVADGKQMKKGLAKKLFTASWESIRERVGSILPEKVDGDERRLFTTKPLPHRRSTVPRTPQDELVLKKSGVLVRRTVKVWRCGSCRRELQPFDKSHNSMSKYDIYICPDWFNCGGTLHPVLDDS